MGPDSTGGKNIYLQVKGCLRLLNGCYRTDHTENTDLDIGKAGALGCHAGSKAEKKISGGMCFAAKLSPLSNA